MVQFLPTMKSWATFKSSSVFCQTWTLTLWPELSPVPPYDSRCWVILLCGLVKSNDMMLGMYMSSMLRCVVALHNLIDNKEVRYGRRMDSMASAEEPPEVPQAPEEGTSEWELSRRLVDMCYSMNFSTKTFRAANLILIKLAVLFSD